MTVLVGGKNRVKEEFYPRVYLGLIISWLETHIHAKCGPSGMKNEGVMVKTLGNIQICRHSLYIGYIVLCIG